MLHKITGYNTQSLLGREQVYFLSKLAFQLLLLRRVHITRLFKGSCYLFVYLGILEPLQTLTTIFIIERHCSLILNGALEVIDAHIATKGSLGDMVMAQQRSACEADAVRRWQQMHQVVSKDAILCPVSLIAHHYDVVVGIDGRCIPVIKLLDKREDKRPITSQFCFQVFTATGDKLLSLDLAQHTAVLESVADLLVQLVAIGEHQEGG